MKRPLITLLTDFGEQDHYVAAMKGVILGICPAANVIDITHQVPPFQIASGAYTLAQATPASAVPAAPSPPARGAIYTWDRITACWQWRSTPHPNRPFLRLRMRSSF